MRARAAKLELCGQSENNNRETGAAGSQEVGMAGASEGLYVRGSSGLANSGTVVHAENGLAGCFLSLTAGNGATNRRFV